MKYIEEYKRNGNINDVLFSDSKNKYTAIEIEELLLSLKEEISPYNFKTIALYGDNSVEWIIVDWLCQALEITIIPIPLYFSEKQIQHIFSTCNVDAVVTDRDKKIITENVSEIGRKDLETIQMSLQIMKKGKSKKQMPNGTGKITFTSGSTGDPKGVCLSNEQLYMQAKKLSEYVAIENPRHLCLLPLSTLLENVAGIYAPVLARGEITIPSLKELGYEGSSSLNIERFLSMISMINPQTIIITPQLLAILIGAARNNWQVPSKLKFIAVGGAKVAVSLLQQAKKMKLPVYEGYGLSECASVVSLNNTEGNVPGSCGKVLPHLEVFIENGEIRVSGNVMLGYVGDKQSWYQKKIRTGDLGYIDEFGYLRIRGRKKDQIISSYGRNISPEWVEGELLVSNLINEIMLVGDGKPYCTALLSVSDEKIQDQEVQQIIDKVNLQLPDYARVQCWYRLKKPFNSIKGLKTVNGKLIRSEIKRSFEKEIESMYQDNIMNNYA